MVTSTKESSEYTVIPFRGWTRGEENGRDQIIKASKKTDRDQLPELPPYKKDLRQCQSRQGTLHVLWGRIRMDGKTTGQNRLAGIYRRMGNLIC